MIDPHAIVDRRARIGAGVSIGPWTHIGPDVEIGDGCEIASHVVVKGPTRLGANNRVFQFATIGEDTPAFAYQGEPTRLEVGDANVFREGVTVHRGTVQDKGRTVIGSNNLFMAYVHIGHDCVVGNNVVMVNNASISGHCEVGDWAIVSGYSGLPQYRRLGVHSFVGGMSLVLKDVPAYVTVNGNPARVMGLNAEGLRRRGFDPAVVGALAEAYRIVYRRSLGVKAALAALEPLAAQFQEVAIFRASVASARHGIIRGRGDAGGG